MIDEILIQPGLIANHGWLFNVSFGGHRHSVLCRHDFWKKMTNEDIPPIDLVRLGLELALDRQIIDSLPEAFSLDNLESRIPDFIKHLRLAAHTEAASGPR